MRKLTRGEEIRQPETEVSNTFKLNYLVRLTKLLY